MAVVGAGPAGLAAAVYAASEGLSVLVLDSTRLRRPGGGLGADRELSRLSDRHLRAWRWPARAFNQALKFGVEVAIPLQVERLDCGDADRCTARRIGWCSTTVSRSARATVVVASGARYRRPPIANLASFEGAGVSYWASPVEARLCEGEEVALIGGGNSAGQAVVFLAPKVKKLHLVVRGEGLEASMSRYLIERISALPNVELHTKTEIVGLEGSATKGLLVRCSATRRPARRHTCHMRHLFLFIGAEPNAAWLEHCVEVDGKGFVTTGLGFANGGIEREVLPFETSRPGVFAIGDVRAGSTKRVAAAVGEGAAVVPQIHEVLAESLTGA